MTAALDAALADAMRGDGPAGVMLMRVLGEAASEAEVHEAIARAHASGDAVGQARLEALQRLWAAHPQAWRIVRSTLAVAAHDARDGSPADALDRWAAIFDRLAAASPEASVALYSLGSPDLLAAATDEIVDLLDRFALLDPAVDVLDLGCGIGRCSLALAPRVRSVLGLDIAAGMVAAARRRCAHLANVRFAQSSGRDLGAVGDETLDLVLAVDVFPYLVQIGGGLAEGHIAACARVLREGGSALILNYAYRGDLAADRQDVAGASARAGLRVERNGTSDLAVWDAATFLLRKPAS